MTYEVITPWSFTRGKDQYIFESFEEIANYFSYEIFTQDFNRAKIIDCYDRQRVDPTEVIGIAKRLRNARYIDYYLRRRGNYEFRCGPVPNLSKGRRHRGSWIRHPETKQRKTAYHALDTDEDIKYYNIKINTKDKTLPTNWDDIIKNGVFDNNWKRFRKTQWK